MKKFLAVLAVVATVAFAAPAFAATNPFMDVPQGHWAYDAVAELASRGIVSGYPDGAFKGAQPATRYEVASLVARALVTVDAEKASKQDLELLKKLVMEFKDELDALGVKVDSLDKRVAVIEEGVGGWKINGAFNFDAKFASSDEDNYLFNDNNKKNEFEKERFRLFLTKQLGEDTYFYAQYRTGANGAAANSGGRGDLNHMRWSHLFVNTALPGDFGFRAGRFAVDFEADNGLYTDNDALFGDARVDGIQLTKKYGSNLKSTLVVGRNFTWGTDVVWEGEQGDSMLYALDINWQPSEKFFLGADAYFIDDDSVKDEAAYANDDLSLSTYGVYAGYSFTPAIQLKGVFYIQDLGDDVVRDVRTFVGGDASKQGDDSPNAWKVVLDVKQEALKFTSLWAEYSQQDNSFIGLEDRYAVVSGDDDYVGHNMKFSDVDGTSKWVFVKAKQQWGDKWSTFARFAMVDFDTTGLDDATEWGVGVGYQLNPAVYLELSYDAVDHGDNDNAAAYNGEESVVRFRTSVNF